MAELGQNRLSVVVRVVHMGWVERQRAVTVEFSLREAEERRPKCERGMYCEGCRDKLVLDPPITYAPYIVVQVLDNNRERWMDWVFLALTNQDVLGQLPEVLGRIRRKVTANDCRQPRI